MENRNIAARIEENLIDQSNVVRYNLSALRQTKCVQLSFNRTRIKCRKEHTNQKNVDVCVFMGSVPVCKPVEDEMSSDAAGRKAARGCPP